MYAYDGIKKGELSYILYFNFFITKSEVSWYNMHDDEYLEYTKNPF